MFAPEGIEFLRSQRLARLATVASDGRPAVDAVGCRFDDGRFVVGGRNLPAARKHRNVAAGNRRVALIVDDLVSTDPWRPRGVKVHGSAEIVARDGMFGPGDYLEITPDVSRSWGVVPQDAPFAHHKVVWDRGGDGARPAAAGD